MSKLNPSLQDPVLLLVLNLTHKINILSKRAFHNYTQHGQYQRLTVCRLCRTGYRVGCRNVNFGIYNGNLESSMAFSKIWLKREKID